MTITTAATATPISRPSGGVNFVDLNTGNLSEYAVQFLNNWYNFIVGMNRVTPCNAVTVSNFITLTPLDAAPLIEGYRDFEIYSFVADATSTGLVTMKVAPRSGTLATLKAYKSNGSLQADTADIAQNAFYFAIYCDHLDTAAGGFVIK